LKSLGAKKKLLRSTSIPEMDDVIRLVDDYNREIK